MDDKLIRVGIDLFGGYCYISIRYSENQPLDFGDYLEFYEEDIDILIKKLNDLKELISKQKKEV